MIFQVDLSTNYLTRKYAVRSFKGLKKEIIKTIKTIREDEIDWDKSSFAFHWIVLVM
ncbi:MAG: hypothetical protein ACW98D_19215 [Promethearchaeota archaeon]|jgi:hypothetical protein